MLNQAQQPSALGQAAWGGRAQTPPQPWMLAVVNRVAGFLDRLHGPLSAAQLIEMAQQRTGLDDFGDVAIAEPLAVLVSAYESEAELSAFGRLAARWDALRFLTNLLQLRAAEKRHPEILAEPIVAPIVITGLPRSGTTFLHGLLAEDPANRVVRCWETIYPLPDRGARPGRRDRRPARVDRQLAGFARLAPELRRLHPIAATTPQECSEIGAHVFQSLRFDTTHHVPSYRRWLDHVGHLEAYRFHKRFLQHLQFRNGFGRWVLKCPDHLFALDAVRAVYPDARLVFLHRDPLEVLQSVARLTETIRRPFTRRIDRGQIGRQVTERWGHGAHLLITEADQPGPGTPPIHLGFRRLIGDPVRVVGALYETLDLCLSEAARARLQAAVAARPDGGYGRNRYRLEEYGLDADTERRRYRDYAARFGV